MSAGEPKERSGDHDPQAMPRLYIASLTDYNAGTLHGVWLDAATDVDAMQAEIGEMLRASPTTHRSGEPAEEWAIHDHEGWGGIPIGEYESLDLLARLSEGLTMHGAAFAAWVQLVGTEEAGDVEGFEDHYGGEHQSLVAYGESLLGDLGIDLAELPGMPESLRRYVQVDVAGWTRDMELSGELATMPSEAGVYVFWL